MSVFQNKSIKINNTMKVFPKKHIPYYIIACLIGMIIPLIYMEFFLPNDLIQARTQIEEFKKFLLSIMSLGLKGAFLIIVITIIISLFLYFIFLYKNGGIKNILNSPLSPLPYGLVISGFVLVMRKIYGGEYFLYLLPLYSVFLFPVLSVLLLLAIIYLFKEKTNTKRRFIENFARIWITITLTTIGIWGIIIFTQQQDSTTTIVLIAGIISALLISYYGFKLILGENEKESQ